ncbi:MAG: energy transducer TonB, partial [Rudanella sp.]|nr:energy transducer TonB [Rudanella sp.]
MAETIAKATLDDIVFANRNKAYGAYSLRKGYPSTIARALLIGATVFILAVLAPTIISAITPDNTDEQAMVEVDLMKLPPPPIDPNEPPPPPPPP